MQFCLEDGKNGSMNADNCWILLCWCKSEDSESSDDDLEVAEDKTKERPEQNEANKVREVEIAEVEELDDDMMIREKDRLRVVKKHDW